MRHESCVVPGQLLTDLHSPWQQFVIWPLLALPAWSTSLEPLFLFPGPKRRGETPPPPPPPVSFYPPRRGPSRPRRLVGNAANSTALAPDRLPCAQLSVAFGGRPEVPAAHWAFQSAPGAIGPQLQLLSWRLRGPVYIEPFHYEGTVVGIRCSLNLYSVPNITLL